MRYSLYTIGATAVALFLLTFTACGGSDRTDDAAPLPEELPTATQPASPTEPAPAEPAPTETASSETSPDPATPAEQPEEIISFNLSGGIVGFCDTLTVDPAGNYLLERCGEAPLSGSLPPEELEILQSWSGELAPFEIVREDNPGGPDNLVSELTFRGRGDDAAGEAQQQAIFDWINGLLIRVRPQPVAAPPTPEPTAIPPGGLCSQVNRPAMLLADIDDPSRLILADAGGEQCDIILPQLPFGRLVTAGGYIYYPALDPDTDTVTVWQLGPDGAHIPLNFTAVTLEQYGPFHFTVSPDRSRIAWAQTGVDETSDPPFYYNSLWVANLDGSELTPLLERVENIEQRYLEPVRFGPDQASLYYALQTDRGGGTIFDYNGRYDSLYSILLTGGEGQLLFACPAGEERPVTCIGDISPDGSRLAVSRPEEGVVQLVGLAGEATSSLTPPAIDFVGPALFGPTGKLAFVSAELAEGGEVAAGYLSLVDPPYTAEPATLLADKTIATIWEWLDAERLAYGTLDDEGSIGTAIITIEGEQTELSATFPLAVLR